MVHDGGLGGFIHALATDGRVCVPLGDATGDEAEARSDAVLATVAAAAANEAPGTAPALDRVAARWAFALLRDGCRLLVYRHLGVDAVAALGAVACPSQPSAVTSWSVDLALRHAPTLCRLVDAAAPDDPLARRLRALLAEWPLSSVGVAGVPVGDLDPVLGDACLLQVYVDRVIAAGDRARLEDPRVAMAVRAAVGAHPELCPALMEVA